MNSGNNADVQIRQAILEDVVSITELCFQLGYPAVQEEVSVRLQSLLEDREHAVLVAELPEGEVVGWVHAYIYKLFHCDMMTEITGLVVDKDCRGQGVGKRLMSAVEGWAREKNCSIVGLRSNIIRKEAHAFYQNLGYDIVKESYTFRKKI